LCVYGQAAPLEPGQVEKRLVDAIQLDLWRERAQGIHDAAAHITVERVVRAEDGDAVAGQGVAIKVVRVAHGKAERLGFVTAGDDAAVVVRQHDDRAAL
jgi:hypothetical protein